MTNPTITLTLSGSDDTIEVARHECSACRCAGFMVTSGDYTPEVEREGSTVLVERPDDAVPLQAGVEGGRELDRTYCEECAAERAEELDARNAIAEATDADEMRRALAAAAEAVGGFAEHADQVLALIPASWLPASDDPACVAESQVVAVAPDGAEVVWDGLVEGGRWTVRDAEDARSQLGRERAE